jgi:hypothetical protein
MRDIAHLAVMVVALAEVDPQAIGKGSMRLSTLGQDSTFSRNAG